MAWVTVTRQSPHDAPVNIHLVGGDGKEQRATFVAGVPQEVSSDLAAFMKDNARFPATVSAKKPKG